jgi:predicted dehydrogenase
MVKRDQKRLRAGVVGAGHMGQYHLLVYAELWDVDLVGLVDVDPARGARLAAQYDCQAFTDHRDLIGQVDVVSIAVPTQLHFPIARDFLMAGVGVLLEKPLTSSLAEARELFRIARERNVVLHVGHVERFNGAVQELRKIVANPILIESRRLGPFVPRVQHDTVVMDLMIHDIDIVLGLVDGEVRRLTAGGAHVHSARPDVASVQILFETGTMANITASRATEQKIRTLAITQPDAYIFLDYTDQDIQIHRRAASEYVLNRESIRYRQESFVEHLFVHKENPLKLEILHLVNSVRDSQRTGPVELSEHDDVRSLAVALAIEEMIRDGRPHLDWPPGPGVAPGPADGPRAPEGRAGGR